MGHVLRINSLPGLWMSFLTYNCARAGLVLLRGKLEGAQLCLAQTRGLLEGFLATDSNPIESALETHAIQHHQIFTAPDRQPIQFSYPRNTSHPGISARAIIGGPASLSANDKPTESYAGSELV
jgi:hypothetical protein